MKIFYVSTCSSKKKYQELFALCKGKLHHSINNFHLSIISGLKENKGDVEAFCGLQVSKNNTEKKFFKGSIEKEDGTTFINPTIININIIKHLCTFLALIYYLIKWIIKNRRDKKIIMIDASYINLTFITVLLAKLFNVQITGIVADIYPYMTEEVESNKKRSILQKLSCKINNFCWNNYDYYVFLTEKMNNILNKNNRPYVVMEGILDVSDLNNSKDKVNDKRIILYTGSIYERYGLKNLVEAFKKLDNKDIELHLYGNTDMLDYLEESCKSDKRIKYFGSISKDQVKQKLEEAYILVNPRPTKDEYTKYSFPSKTLEYMATGNICISTKLDGIPKEYDEYLNYFEDDSENAIYEKLAEVLDKNNQQKLLEKANNAKDFVIKNKNKNNQTKRILSIFKLDDKEYNISSCIQVLSLIILTFISIVPYASNKYLYLLSMIFWLLSTYIKSNNNIWNFIIKYRNLFLIIFIWIMNYLINIFLGRGDLILEYANTYIRILSIIVVGLYLCYDNNKFLNKAIVYTTSIFLIAINIYSIFINLFFDNISRILATGLVLNINKFGIASYSYIYGLIFIVILLVPYLKNIRDKKLSLTLLISSILLILSAEFLFSILLIVFALIIYYLKIDNLKKFGLLILIGVVSLLLLSKPLSISLKYIAKIIPSDNISIRVDDISKLLEGDIENTLDIKARFAVYNKSINKFMKEPVIGVGFNQDTKIGNHSTIIDEFAKFGLIGGIILVTLFIYVFKLFYNVFNTKKEKTIYFICSLIYIIFMIINNAMLVTPIYFILLLTPLFIKHYSKGE